MTTSVLDFNWTKPPLSLNDRGHWRARSEAIADVRLAAKVRARNVIPALDHATVELVWYVTDKTRRDADNPVATLKALCDGLVDAGVVPDDTPRFMTKLPVSIRYRSKSDGQGVELHVTHGYPAPVEYARSILRTHDGGRGACVCDACALARLVLGDDDG